MAGVAVTPGGPFEKQPIQQEKLGAESRDEKRLDEDSSSPAASVDDEAVPAGNGTQLGSTRDHVFSEPASADYWRKVYEQAGYENRHRFDPSFEWTAEEEKKLIRKIDWRIMLWAWVMFVALDIHRKNINRAISDNMLPEIGMNTNDFNYGQTIFLISFLSAELPSGLVSKKLGADRWIPTLIVAWSIVAGCQAFLTNRAGFYAVKALLGLLMGGFIPDVVLYLTYFYKSNELPVRLAWFWTALSTSNILGSLVAAGVLQMRGVAGWGGWRWL